MKWIILSLLVITCFRGSAQQTEVAPAFATGIKLNNNEPSFIQKEEIRVSASHWKIDRNRVISGGLVFLAGLSKGFNETLQFHWKEFHRQFPHARAQWFNPTVSWRNKYRNGDPNQGPKSFLSTSVLIGFTDQYHLNNMINRLSWTSALVVHIGGGKRPLKQYLFDLLYYSACNYTGFATAYYPFNKYKGK